MMIRVLMMLLMGAWGLALAGCAVESRLRFDAPETTGEFEVKWRRHVGAVRDNFLPVVADGRVCFADADGDVVLLDAADGATVRSFRMDFEPDLLTVYHERGVFSAFSEAALERELLSGSVGCGEGVVAALDDEGQLAAYDEEGNELWQEDLRARILSPPVVFGGRVFLRSSGRLAARALRKGTELWQYENPLRGNLQVRVENGVLAVEDAVYAGFGEGAVVALRANNGEVLWENTVSDSDDEEDEGVGGLQEVTTPIQVGDYVCAGAYQGSVSCFNARYGEAEWRRPFSTAVKLGVDAANGRLFAVSERGNLTAFDAETGEELWENDESHGASAPLVLGDAVVVGGSDGRLRAFSAEDGTLIAVRRLGAGRIARLVPVGEGDFIATLDSGYLIGDGMVRAGLEREE